MSKPNTYSLEQSLQNAEENDFRELVNYIQQSNLDGIGTVLDRNRDLVNKIDNNGETPLIIATKIAAEQSNNNSVDGANGMVALLLERGADVNFRNRNGSALAIAISPRCKDKTTNIKANNINLIHALLNGGANPNDNSLHSNQPILISLSGSGRTDLVQAILQHPGVDVNATGYQNGSTLTVACWTASKNAGNMNAGFDIVQLLVNYGGVNIDHQDSFGRTALSRAKDPKITRFLLEHNANPNIIAGDRDQHCTALMVSARFGNSEQVQILLEYGANKNMRDANGHTAATIAHLKNNSEIGIFIANYNGPYSTPSNSVRNADSQPFKRARFEIGPNN